MGPATEATHVITHADVDERLWFKHKHCEYNGDSKHFVIGNCHTFPGRMLAWCPDGNRTLCVSRSEMSEFSYELEWWMRGFLHGNEPEPCDAENDDAWTAPEYLNNIAVFHQEGVWKQ